MPPALGRFRIAARMAGSMAAPGLSAIDITAGGGGTPQISLRGAVADLRAGSGLDLKIAASTTGWWRIGGADGPRLRVTGKPGQNLQASGTIEDALNWRGVRLALTANISDSAAAGRIFGADLPRLPAIRAAARMSGPRGGYALAGVKLAHAATVIAGDVAITRGAKRFKVTATAASPLLDIAAFVRPAAAGSAAQPIASGARAIPDLALSLDFLRSMDADLDLRVGNAGRGASTARASIPGNCSHVSGGRGR